jgi:TonB-linked SusC/RagA family outer membrane protein
MNRGRLHWVFLIAAFLSVTPGLGAQTGTVAGRVTSQETGGPLAAVQVFITGLNVGNLTTQDGRFLILNVPAGTHTLGVQRIGYRPGSQVITVVAGQTLQQNFTLSEEALGLDEIVVTGTGGAARRREVGNSVETVNAAEFVQTSSSVESLLQGQALGANIQLSSGQVGDGGRIRLRGNVSAALSNDPLIYIDGVRVRSEQYRTLNPVNLGQQYGTFATPTPLQDINPADIERIEIIKGPAATTLYGTEASAGVIQIFTKRGSGAPVWEASVEQGIGFKNIHGQPKTLRGNDTENYPNYTIQSGGNADYLWLDPWMVNPHRQKYSTSVRGGVGDFSYYVSGNYNTQDDIFVTGYEDSYGFRGNVNVELRDGLFLEWNTSYNTREIKNIGCGDNNLCARSSYGIYDWTKASLDSLVYMPDRKTDIDRWISGTTVRWQPVTDLTTRLTVGYDRANNEGRIVYPYGYRQRPLGYISRNGNVEQIYSLDWATTYALNFTESFGADLSGGLQWISQQSTQTQLWGQDFSGPGEFTINSAASSLARESLQKVNTGGGFGQAVFKFQDRYFLTVGVRVDGNSAFGQDFGWQVYPKVSGSYVVSDEAFWPAVLGEMKLRAAWGKAGRAPGAFDAVRVWEPGAWDGQTAYEPDNVGNPELGPETTTEIELGFDQSALDGRLNIAFTYYRRVTSDALVSQPSSPSEGPWGSALLNLGELEGKGFEVGVHGSMPLPGSMDLGLGVDLSTNHSKVLDMGGASESGSLALGHPFPNIRGTLIRNPDEIAAPDVVTQHRFGSNLPTLMVAPRLTIDFASGISLLARGEYKGGFYVNDGATQWAMIQGSLEQPICFDAYPLLAAGRDDELTARERVWCGRTDFDRNSFIYPGDFFKLREVSARIPLAALPGVPPGSILARATLGLSGENLYRWVNDEFFAYDPDQAGGFSPSSTTTSLWQFPAPPRYFTASVRWTF